MLKKLRLRFILISMVSIFFVLAITMSAINIANFAMVEKNARNTLVEVIEQGAKVPIQPDPIDPGEKDHKEDFKPIEEHYFITIFNEDGSIKESNYGHMFKMSPEECEKLSIKVYKNELTGRKYGDFRFTKVTKEDKTTSVAFVDIKPNLENAKSFLLVSMLISVGAYAAIFGLIILASKIAFKTSEEAYKKQKKFITNASHELKTPLTVISADLDLIEMDYGKSEWSDSIRNQVHVLTNMTKEMVDLSRLEENDPKNYPFLNFSISDVATKMCEQFEPLFDREKIEFSHEISENLEMQGNKSLFERLIAIFLENSLKYTGGDNKKSYFDISKINKNRIEFVFSNTLDKDDELDIKQIMERFYRSPSNKKDGSGIGLSIADEIIKLHNGKIKINKDTDKIFFEISFGL